MAIIDIPLKDLEKLTNLKKNELISIMNDMGLDFELIDSSIEFDITPNRPDLLGRIGLARAINTFKNGKPSLMKVKDSSYEIIIDKSVKNVRPFTACAVVKNLNLSDEAIKDLINLQEKLHQTLCRQRKKAAIGIYPLEAISWPITFKALPPKEIKFKPLNADKEMSGLEILKELDVGKKYSHLLRGKELFPTFIDAKGKILSMPPIINSEETGRVTTNTKAVFIEVSGFDPSFLNKVLTIILRNMEGDIYGVKMNYPYNALNNKKSFISPDLSFKELVIDKVYIEKLLGEKISNLSNLLAKMDLTLRNNKVLIPPYRIDLFNQRDIVEEVAIAKGYNSFSPELPNISTFGELDSLTIRIEEIADQLTALSLLEVKNYSLIGLDEAKITTTKDLIVLPNPKNTNYNTLRPNLLAGLLQTFKRWMNQEYPQRIFEVGPVFYKEKGEIIEKDFVGIALTGSNEDFSSAKRIVYSLGLMKGLNFSFKPCNDKRFIKGRCAEILLNKKSIGVFGELSPEILSFYGLEMPVSYIEFREII